MGFKQATAVFLLSLFGAQSAAIVTRDQIPQQEQESGQMLVLLINSEITPGGDLTIWGLPDNENSASTIIDDAIHSDVHRRCGSNQIRCK